MNILRDSSLGSSTHKIPGSGDGEAHEGIYVCSGKKIRYWNGYRDDSDGGGEGERGVEVKGDGKGTFSEIEVRKGLRGLGREERMTLISITLDLRHSLLSLIPLHQKYVGNLAPHLVLKVFELEKFSILNRY